MITLPLAAVSRAHGRLSVQACDHRPSMVILAKDREQESYDSGTDPWTSIKEGDPSHGAFINASTKFEVCCGAAEPSASEGTGVEEDHKASLLGPD
jgi:hypothetical protein